MKAYRLIRHLVMLALLSLSLAPGVSPAAARGREGDFANAHPSTWESTADSAWQCDPSGGPSCYRSLNAVTMVAGGEGWAVGEQGAILHYTHQQYAREIATGNPARYNPEDPPTSGFSSLTYPWLLAIGYLLGFQGNNLSLFAFLLGCGMLVVSSLLIYRIVTTLTRRLRPDPLIAPANVGFAASVVFLLSGGLLWGFLSGMDSGLFITLVLLVVDSLVHERKGCAVVFLLGMVLTRSEGGVLGIVFVGVVALQRILDRSVSPMVPLRWQPAVVAAVAVQPAVYLALTGAPTAAGMISKSWLYIQSLRSRRGCRRSRSGAARRRAG